MTIDGAHPAPAAEGIDRTPTVVNSYVGARDRWRAGVPTYRQVAYRGVYPGTDLVWYGTGADVEHDFVLAPGDLVLTRGTRTLVQRAPRPHQTVDGRRRTVEGRYALRGPDRVGFAVGTYDPARTLVIDPVLAWSTYLGGNAADTGHGVAVHDGSAYVAGETSSPDFPVRTPVQLDQPDVDAFLTKFDASGQPVYSTYLGGAGADRAVAVAVTAGRAYLTGWTGSSELPVTPSALQAAHQGGQFDAFAVKLGPTGALVYGTYLGSAGHDSGSAVAVRQGLAHVAGGTSGAGFPTTPGAVQPTQPLPIGFAEDGFVVKLDRPAPRCSSARTSGRATGGTACTRWHWTAPRSSSPATRPRTRSR